MRIGFFTDGYLPMLDGVATSVSETVKELEARGHEVIIVAAKYPGYVDKNKNVVRLTSVKIHKKPDVRVALNLPDASLRKVLAMDFDIIHGHSGGPITLLGWEIARRKNIPFVLTYHTLWNRYTHYFMKGKVVSPKFMERLTRLFGNRSDYLIAPTKRVEKELRSYGVKKPIKVVPSGIDLKRFREAEKGFLRKKLNLKDEPIVLFVGRLGKEKSVDFLIESFRGVLKEKPTANLVIVGDGIERKRLEALARKNKIEENVHFTGDIQRDEIAKAYKDADVFVFASTTETQGLVVPEALSAGVPVVAVDDPAFGCVKNGENGYLVKKNKQEFAEKILEIITDKSLADKLSKNAVSLSDDFSVKKTGDLLISVYFELLEKYNEESVGRIMRENEKSEMIFVGVMSFWSAVILLRFLTFLFYYSPLYPTFDIGGVLFYHATVGLILFTAGAILALIKKKPGLVSLVLMGVGAGFAVDEVWSLLTNHNTLSDYWNPVSLVPILLVGLLPNLFTRKKIGDRPKFYISTVEQKHTNPENPKISVVVPAYNEGEFIEPTLKSLINQTYKNFELIVVDNNSSDNTSEVAKRYGARVVKEKKPGVSQARQAGFMAAKGEIIASTDADTVVPQDWLERIAARYERNKNLSGFGGLSNLYSGPVTARAAGRYLFSIFWWVDKVLNGGYNMAGFNMSARKSSFLEFGGFDVNLKMGEDIDLSQKLRGVGEVSVDPSLVVYSSGRRYKDGLVNGLMAYAPYWISKVIFKKEKPFEFHAVRSEKSKAKRFAYFPLVGVVALLTILFYFSNQ